MSHRLTITGILISLTLLTSTLSAQSVTLEKYVKEGLKNNQALKSQNLSYLKSMEVLKEAKGLYMPQVSFNASYSLASGGRAIQFPVGDLFNPIHSTLNTLLENNAFPTDLENVNEQFLPHNFQETKVRIIQPIIQQRYLLQSSGEQIDDQGAGSQS